MKKTIPILLFTLAFLTGIYRLAAQGTAFTYQGRLVSGATPANGSYDLTFALFNASSNGSAVGGTHTNAAVGVSNGLFAVTVDFGPVFNGTPYWLQIGVRTNGAGLFNPLSPRQALTPAPYAVTAENVTGAIALAQLPATVALLSDSGTGNLFAGQNAGNPAVTGTYNTGVGFGALSNTSSGGFNTASGEDALFHNTSGSYNTAAGVGALLNNTSGSNNVAEGFGALEYTTNDNEVVAIGVEALQNDNAYNPNTSVSGNGENTAVGFQALQADSTGPANTAVGYQALNQDTNGFSNTALGDSALTANTSGNGNTATGAFALYSSASGYENTATGWAALFSGTTGFDNTAAGVDALYGNSTGNNNTAIGAYALSAFFEFGFLTGSGNTAEGAYALSSDVMGNDNTANGFNALSSATNGNENVAEGAFSLQDLANAGSQNTAVGSFSLPSLTNGNFNIGLGFDAGGNINNGSDNIDIGSPGTSGDDNLIRIGSGQAATFIAGISGVPVGGAPVWVNTNGQLGIQASAQRFKKNIRSMNDASDVLLSLRPVTFKYQREIDPQGLPQFGLVAEEVDKVDPDLVVRDGQGTVCSVRYEAVNAMLLNEFLKQHRKVEEQNAEIEMLKQRLEKLESALGGAGARR